MSENHGDSVRDDIFSKAVRAGKRTYFFDVKSTRGNDLYLTITESKKRFHDDGNHSFEKHKIFLYKEDFEKFSEGLTEALDKIVDLRSGDNEFVDPEEEMEDENKHVDGNKFEKSEVFTDVNFEDLED
ncbi:MAG: DUF3276 family protein [Cryomorphaceae bacterium]|nr:PUR family DNA/RNA-binding protein [Flavobacteriales bacterium]